jgi:hypothetical protein
MGLFGQLWAWMLKLALKPSKDKAATVSVRRSWKCGVDVMVCLLL